jgi:hypothetical protein
MNRFQNQLSGGPVGTAPNPEPDPAIVADEQALSKIRSMCAVAKASAESVALAIDTEAIGTDLARINRRRFASARRMSLELAKTIADAAYRDVALVHIIELCITANDMEASRVLVPGIQSEPIREELLQAYPALFR